MVQTTPAQDRYTRFSCPNPLCAWFNQPGQGTITHRSWTGTRQHIERLRCPACDREFSEREGTLMARSKLPEDTVIRLLKWQRWGVCDAGTADICAVDLKTVHRFQRVAAQRAETHHRQVVREVDVPGVQLDEAHSKLRPHQVAWIPTALAMGSWFLLWLTLARARRSKPRRWWLRLSPACGRCLSFSPMAGKPIARRCSRSWVSSLVADGGGRWGASRNHGSSLPKTCSTPRLSRSATRRGRWWRCAGKSCSAGPAALCSNCAYESSAQRSRPPSWSDGMGPCEGWSHPCGAAPAVCPGAVPATGDGSG